MVDTRKSAVVEASGDAALTAVTDTVKIGVKGPGVKAWAERIGVVFPAKLYDCVVAEGAIVARVGGDELTVEAALGHALLSKMEKGLETREVGVYRIEQQSVTMVLRGEKAVAMLLQTCGVEMTAEPVDRIVFTRVAGVSCGIIPSGTGADRSYRVWCDYTLAPYLWENLCTILSELGH